MLLKTLNQFVSDRLARRVHFAVTTGRQRNMQATETTIGREQSLDVPTLKKETPELSDVFSRYLPLLYKTAYRYLGNSADA